MNSSSSFHELMIRWKKNCRSSRHILWSLDETTFQRISGLTQPKVKEKATVLLRHISFVTYFFHLLYFLQFIFPQSYQQKHTWQDRETKKVYIWCEWCVLLASIVCGCAQCNDISIFERMLLLVLLACHANMPSEHCRFLEFNSLHYNGRMMNTEHKQKMDFSSILTIQNSMRSAIWWSLCQCLPSNRIILLNSFHFMSSRNCIYSIWSNG